jgi:hypothetical protein
MEPEPELDFDSTPTVAERMRRERASILKQPSKSSLLAATHGLSFDSDEEDDPAKRSPEPERLQNGVPRSLVGPYVRCPAVGAS